MNNLEEKKKLPLSRKPENSEAIAVTIANLIKLAK